MTTDRCPTCDKPRAGDVAVSHAGGCTCPGCLSVCWLDWGVLCEPVDWRARALAAEAELAGASAAICDVSDTIRRALDGDEGGMRAPYHGPLAVVLRYPSIAADLRRLDEVLTIGSPRAAAMRDAAAQWAKVAPLIERLRAEYSKRDVTDHDELAMIVDNFLAATEDVP